MENKSFHKEKLWSSPFIRIFSLGPQLRFKTSFTPIRALAAIGTISAFTFAGTNLWKSFAARSSSKIFLEEQKNNIKVGSVATSENMIPVSITAQGNEIFASFVLGLGKLMKETPQENVEPTIPTVAPHPNSKISFHLDKQTNATVISIQYPGVYQILRDHTPAELEIQKEKDAPIVVHDSKYIGSRIWKINDNNLLVVCNSKTARNRKEKISPTDCIAQQEQAVQNAKAEFTNVMKSVNHFTKNPLFWASLVGMQNGDNNAERKVMMVQADVEDAKLKVIMASNQTNDKDINSFTNTLNQMFPVQFTNTITKTHRGEFVVLEGNIPTSELKKLFMHQLTLHM